MRLHEGLADPRPCYGDAALDRWVQRILEVWGHRDVFVFFNNDHLACAPLNATRFRELAEGAGLHTS